MDWIQIKITTTNKGIDPLCGMLYDLGITGIEISDKEDFMEFLENNRKYWDYVDEELERLKEADSCITLYFSNDDEGKALLAEVTTAVNELRNSDTEKEFGSLDILSENMKDEDWSENWKQFFKPLEIGKRVLVVPEWETEIPDSNRVKFLINPGLSFGTGSHESTKMCIEIKYERYR